ncbi:DoxX family protein [Paenibacillus pinihumi]|uniref:DoxX family protein n=1 Tax=Paenibacillus pinihumi TaxID=669462 RepID=UPI00049090BB|nr:DoxX family protein [Paenibacillus pinihumi]
MFLNILQVVLGVFFIFTGTTIISGKMAKEFKRFGMPSFFNFLTGFIEIVGALGLIIGIWMPIVAFLSGALLGSTMLVAALTLVFIARDPLIKALPATVLCLLSFIIAILSY